MSLSVRSTLLIGLTAACMAGPSRVADAGTYDVGACTDVVGYINNSWKFTTDSQAYVESHSGCNEGPTHEVSAGLSNLAAADVLKTGAVPVGANGIWGFVAPVGTAITEVKGQDDLFKDTNNDWEVFLKDASGSVLGGQTCTVVVANGYCETSGPFQESGIVTTGLSLGIICTENVFNNCPDGATLHEVRAELDYATVTIDDPVDPSGVMGNQIASGPQSGTISILGSATDDTAGLLSLSVVNDTDEVVGGPSSVPGSCNYSFTTPCPTKAEDLAIPLDTTKLPNGQNQIRIEATNAAHDEGFSPAYTLNVGNSLPKQEGGSGSPSGGESGSGSKGGGSSELAKSAGDNESLQDSSGAHEGQSTLVTKSPLPALQLETKVTRSVGGELLISGRVSTGATGALDFVAHGVVRGHHVWAHKATVAIKYGHFSLWLRLPRGLGRRPVRISLSYPGGLFFGPARVSLVIRARHSQTDG